MDGAARGGRLAGIAERSDVTTTGQHGHCCACECERRAALTGSGIQSSRLCAPFAWALRACAHELARLADITVSPSGSPFAANA